MPTNYSFTNDPFESEERGTFKEADGYTRSVDPAGPRTEFPTFDATTWGGRKRDVKWDPATGQLIEVAGTSGEEMDIARYRKMAGQTQAAPVINQGPQAQTRTYQTGAIGLARDAALGTSPSAAEQLNARQTRDAMNAQTSLANSVRGGARARVASARYANRGNMVTGVIGRQQGEAIRANEMAGARHQLMDATSDLRDQDLGLATAQAKLEADRRGEDFKNEAFFERMGFDVRNAGMGARLNRTAAEQAGAAANRARGIQDTASEWENTKRAYGTAAAGISGAASGYARSQAPDGKPDPYDTSDRRAKYVYSDDQTKLKAAFEEGAKYADASNAGKPIKPPSYAVSKREPAKVKESTPAELAAFANKLPGGEAEITAREKAALRNASERAESPRPAARSERPRPAGSAAFVGSAVQPPEVDGARATAAARDVAMSPVAKQVMRAGLPAILGPAVGGGFVAGSDYAERKTGMWSDVVGKEVIDLDEPVIDLDEAKPTAMRDGPSDRRSYNFEKTFHRDTPADQKRVAKKYQADAGKAADSLMASYKSSVDRGPAAKSKDEVPPDLMYAAMKSMEPSMYAYKPAFTPPEQAPGELQAGPMANKMERDPVAGMVVKQDPATGMRQLDKDKLLKLTAGSLAVLAEDVEKLKRKRK